MSRYGLINGRIHSYLPLDSSSWGRRCAWNFLIVRIRVCKVVSVQAINALGLRLPPFLIAVLYIGCQFYVPASIFWGKPSRLPTAKKGLMDTITILGSLGKRQKLWPFQESNTFPQLSEL